MWSDNDCCLLSSYRSVQGPLCPFPPVVNEPLALVAPFHVLNRSSMEMSPNAFQMANPIWTEILSGLPHVSTKPVHQDYPMVNQCWILCMLKLFNDGVVWQTLVFLWIGLFTAEWCTHLPYVGSIPNQKQLKQSIAIDCLQDMQHCTIHLRVRSFWKILTISIQLWLFLPGGW